MEKRGDNFWKWGNARKRLLFTKDISLENGPLHLKQDRLSFKLHSEKDTSSQVSAPQFEDGLGEPVGSSSMELNFFNSKYKKMIQHDEVFVKGKSCVALDILADVASRALQQLEEEEKEKEKVSVGQWKIYGVSDSLKIVIKRVKKTDTTPSISDCDFLAASKVGNTITSTVSSPTKRCIEDIQVENPNVNERMSKRNRFHYLSTKYADSLLDF